MGLLVPGFTIQVLFESCDSYRNCLANLGCNYLPPTMTSTPNPNPNPIQPNPIDVLLALEPESSVKATSYTWKLLKQFDLKEQMQVGFLNCISFSHSPPHPGLREGNGYQGANLTWMKSIQADVYEPHAVRKVSVAANNAFSAAKSVVIKNNPYKLIL